MTEQEFQEKARELVRDMVNTIAKKKYKELLSSIPPKPSWAAFIDAEPTPENACLGFGKWLDEQLAMWSEDEGKPFVVDPFDEDRFEKPRPMGEGMASADYQPASHGEELDFWFEIDFQLKKDGQVTAVFDVNI